MAANQSESSRALEDLESWLNKPMAFLGLVWLVLLVVELTRGLNPVLYGLGLAIWGLFVLNFLLEYVLAPAKVAYLRRNWLTALSLVIPALRAFRALRAVRALRAARAARGIRFVRLVSTVNRGMRALGETLSRQGAGYVFLLTLAVTFLGAAGMLSFESGVPNGDFDGFGEALWWTAMIMTTMGTEHWPRTPAGRTLCFFLALYAFAVFGYVTATIASFFIRQDKNAGPAARSEK